VLSGCTACGATTLNYASCTVTDVAAWVASNAETPGTAISAVVCATGFY